MNDATESTTSKRSSWLAALLSFALPGVGQVYCGRLARGLTFGLIYGLAIPVALGLLACLGPAPSVVFALLAVVAAFGVAVAAGIDAYRLAMITRPDYGLKAYNHPAVYLLIGLMIQGSSIGYALHIRASLFEAFRVTAPSMFPTIAVHDRILGNKIAYRRANPQHGDVILFHPPTSEWRSTYIKRIVALGGDTIRMTAGELYLNGRKLPREPITDQAATVNHAGQTVPGTIYREHDDNAAYETFLAAGASEQALEFGEIKVPENCCFVLGDNRSDSLDSRQFGPVAYGQIKARADYIYWPVDTWSRFGRIE